MSDDKLVSRETLDEINKELVNIIKSNLTALAGKPDEDARLVESVLRDAGFQSVTVRRYNAASLRVRVIDPRFEKLSPAARDALVDPYLSQLPERIQSDIISLNTFAPNEHIKSLFDPDEELEHGPLYEKLHFNPEHDPEELNAKLNGINDRISELKVKHYDLQIKLDALQQWLENAKIVFFANTVLLVVVILLFLWVLKTHTL